MKVFASLLLLLLLHGQEAVAQRRVINWNFGWKFHRGTVGIKDGPVDVSGWESIDVPHDFQISQPWVEPGKDEKRIHFDGANFNTRLSARGYKEMGEGWYAKTLHHDDGLKGKRIVLDFEGILLVGDVYLNGERVGGTDYGYLGFEIDLTDKLRKGYDNQILVRACTSGPYNSRWYTGAGLYRDVRLVVSDPQLYFPRHALHVSTKDNREVNLEVEVMSHTADTVIDMECRILDAGGNEVWKQRQHHPYFFSEESNQIGDVPSFYIALPPVTIENAHLWSCDTPYRYTAEVTLYDHDGKAVDRISDRFGIRKVEIGPEYGLKINGTKVLFQGNSAHHSLGALGAAAYPRAIERYLKQLKSFGFNAIRTSHNPYSTSFLNLCDSLGILVVDELYDKWLQQYCGGRVPFTAQWQHDVTEWIRRDRNHPSVIAWSLSNEQQTFADLPVQDWGATQFRMMKLLAQRYDSTRLFTNAMHPRGRLLNKQGVVTVGLKPMGVSPAFNKPSPLAMASDFQSYNYAYEYFKTDGSKWPWMTFFQSEATIASMGKNFYGMNLDKVIGISYWGAVDYLGESSAWPNKGSVRGVFDVSMRAKPKAWLAKSMFLPDTPVVHMGIIGEKDEVINWNGKVFTADGTSEIWNRNKGSKCKVRVYTNTEETELRVNGKVIGRTKNNTDKDRPNQVDFDNIVYQPGFIEAIGYNSGKEVARHRLETTGEAVRLVLTPEEDSWQADGQELLHVRVTAVDRKGRQVPMANEKLTFTIDGPAKLVALDNGDLSSGELHSDSQRSLRNGYALAIIRSERKAGKVILTVSGEGYKPQRLTLMTR